MWDYTAYAATYHARPGYAPEAIDELVTLAGAAVGSWSCDIGAGTGHLTIPLLERGLQVHAVEPNAAMRDIGINRTRHFDTVQWYPTHAERTSLEGGRYALVTFGSSFNTTDKSAALAESARILQPDGWIGCIWNHRDLDDPLQSEIEALIRWYIPAYSYGDRRDDQSSTIVDGGHFDTLVRFEAKRAHRVSAGEWIKAWRSHATLGRQAGSDFDRIVEEIGRLVVSCGGEEIVVPYITRVWAARARRGTFSEHHRHPWR